MTGLWLQATVFQCLSGDGLQGVDIAERPAFQDITAPGLV
jgi:hypothetical protein